MVIVFVLMTNGTDADRGADDDFKNLLQVLVGSGAELQGEAHILICAMVLRVVVRCASSRSKTSSTAVPVTHALGFLDDCHAAAHKLCLVWPLQNDLMFSATSQRTCELAANRKNFLIPSWANNGP